MAWVRESPRARGSSSPQQAMAPARAAKLRAAKSLPDRRDDAALSLIRAKHNGNVRVERERERVYCMCVVHCTCAK